MQLLLLIIIHLYFVASNSYINETAHKLKYILSCRHTRCVPRLGMKVDSLAEKTLKVMRNTDRLSEYLSVFNVSECDGEASGDYVRRHILDGLLITDDVPDTHWNEYKSIYNKKYASQTHEDAALSVWKKNLRKVAEHNQLYLSGKRSYTLHLNMFGDWPLMSYVEDLLKLIWTIPLYDPARDPHRTAYKRNLHQKIPREVDWRARGYKPRLEEQYHCGACYAFAITHALQAQVYKHHGDWRELSPQQIVDCSLPDGNQGCNGGSLEAALRYASRAGLIRESYYPYRGRRGHCHYRSGEVSARPQRWATLPAGDELAIERAVATIGPLAVAVNAEPFTFQLYRSGIYDDPFCVPWKMNHAMLLVGYTPEYWVLLNWWGRHWGERGYMRIRRGYNVCGVANMATLILNGVEVRLQWIPSHVGLRGNEVADSLAAEALRDGIPLHVIPHYTDHLPKVKADMYAKFKLYFDECSQNKGIWYKSIVDQSPRVPCFSSRHLKRNELTICFRTRTYHVPPNKFNYIMKKRDDPYCSICQKEEYLLHLILECKINEQPRLVFLRDSGCSSADLLFLFYRILASDFTDKHSNNLLNYITHSLSLRFEYYKNSS